jgi:autotransporter adhesin
MGAVFIGVGSSAVDTGAAVGDNSTASQAGSAAYGFGANASATNATALGANSVASGVSSLAAGNGAQATATSSVALGNGASATAANSVALGSGSVASTPNTVSVGSVGNERRITNVAAGFAPTDAATMGQLNANTTEARRGIAAVAALSPGVMPSAPGKTTISVNTGFYQGEAGVGVGVAHRLDWSVPTMIHGSYANAAGNGHVGRIGLAFEF